MATKILIYDDNANLRNSMQTMLQWNDAFEVVAALPNPSNVVKDVEKFQPDVVLMDIDMPGTNGVEAVILIRQHNESLPIIMVTVFEDNENIFNALCAGATGYLLKNNFEQIPAAIKDVMQGGAPMTGSVARKVLHLFKKAMPEKKAQSEGLTNREVETLQYLVKGYSYKMIAEELQISLETVRTHIKKIYRKMQVSSATGAVYKFMQGNEM
jgi:DNA-binding NarL/FixJ family response regulator